MKLPVRLPRRVTHSVRMRLTHPVVQVLASLGGVIGGAALIGRVALGIAVVFASLLILADGLWRDDSQVRSRHLRSVSETHDDVMESYRRMP